MGQPRRSTGTFRMLVRTITATSTLEWTMNRRPTAVPQAASNVENHPAVLGIPQL